VLANRRNSLGGAVAPSNPPCAHLSTLARRLSVDQHNPTNHYVPRRASADYVTRRTSVDYTPMSEGWGIPIKTFPREITWLAGAPGSGKGTNSAHISLERGYQAPTIVMSSLLENPECKRIKDAGGMVDDETVQRALLEELAKPEYKNGVVVDGFPRTEKQAEWLKSLHDTIATPSSPVNFNFVMLFIDEGVSVARQLSRGETIRKLNMVRTANGMAPLEERATDVSDAAAHLRYSNFMKQYEAVNKLSERFPLVVVDASAPIDAVRQHISSTLQTTAKPTKSSRPLSASKRQFGSPSLKMSFLTPVSEKSFAYL